MLEAGMDTTRPRYTHQAVEEEVVVVGHRGIVEHGRHLRSAGVLDQQFSGLCVGVDGVCCSRKTMVSVSYQRSLSCTARKLTLRHQVQLVNEQTLVLRPGEIERLGR